MKILLIGYGKMGKAIEKVAQKRNHTIASIINHNNSQELSTINNSQVDVAIEFTNPLSAYNNIYQCIKNQIPVVSGTTGWLDQKLEINALCKKYKGAFLHSNNFSIGANIFIKINEYANKLINKYPFYDVSIKEVHHKEKKDSPSGTAILLAETIINNNDSKDNWTQQDITNKKSIIIKSKRRGEINGIHKAKYASKNDEIKIMHIAYNRKNFALGAILAAEWIIEKKGIFSINDMLDLGM